MLFYYLKLYKPMLAPRFEWDGNRLVKGPLIVKMDSGSVRQSKSLANIKYRQDMHALGFYTAPGLLNLTQVSQEMDDLYDSRA